MTLNSIYRDKNFIEITSQLFNQENFADIKFIFLRPNTNIFETIFGHTTVLLIRCPKLYTLCHNKVVGSCSVLMEQNTHQNFFEFIKFIYTDNCIINLGNFKEILLLARTYELHELVEFCWEVLENFTVNNCLDVLQFTMKYNEFNKIKLKVLDWISWNFSTVIKSIEFMNIEKNVVAEILKMDEVGNDFTGEWEVIVAVFKYVHYQRERNVKILGSEMRHLLGDIIKLIRFPTLEIRDFLKICMNKETEEMLTAEERSNMFTDIMGGRKNKFGFIQEKRRINTITIPRDTFFEDIPSYHMDLWQEATPTIVAYNKMEKTEFKVSHPIILTEIYLYKLMFEDMKVTQIILRNIHGNVLSVAKFKGAIDELVIFEFQTLIQLKANSTYHIYHDCHSNKTLDQKYFIFERKIPFMTTRRDVQTIFKCISPVIRGFNFVKFGDVIATI